jgi:hypothetical protein
MERRTKGSKSAKVYDTKKAARKTNWYFDTQGRAARAQRHREAERGLEQDLTVAAKALRVAAEISRTTSEQLRQVKEDLRVTAEDARREADELRNVIHQARRVKQELLAATERLQEAADEHTATLAELSRHKHSRASSKN